jgi:predicted Fe-S protein YdhL (DUF1289 family)
VPKLPSPCIGVCKFREGGHCLGCSMTRPQKRGFKRLDGKKARRAFLSMLGTQQALLGRYRAWVRAYRRKCEKKGVESPV